MRVTRILLWKSWNVILIDVIKVHDRKMRSQIQIVLSWASGPLRPAWRPWEKIQIFTKTTGNTGKSFFSLSWIWYDFREKDTSSGNLYFLLKYAFLTWNANMSQLSFICQETRKEKQSKSVKAIDWLELLMGIILSLDQMQQHLNKKNNKKYPASVEMYLRHIPKG